MLLLCPPCPHVPVYLWLENAGLQGCVHHLVGQRRMHANLQQYVKQERQQPSLWAVLTKTAWAPGNHLERTAVTTGMVMDEFGFRNKPTLDPPTLRRARAVLLQGCCCTCALWLVTRCTEQVPWPCTATDCMCCNTRCPAHLHVLCCAKQQHTAAHICRLEHALAQACSPALTCPVALSLLPYWGSAPPQAADRTRRLLESACNA